ncbi:Protein of unknown function [Saccharopolyspora antimicrobica]|uniref:Uncharacterized protein DUF2550 n=1 Tax=Saccharopolyspora antimicrobica TaxID=455193 RepID=A0A1I5KIP8_9PSEU|nr:DUF2550 domain-containing protein [Saccharopolyspora antimicrobica]RKT85677.1 uncharacterized protein DUF2550 [Saccharopolyspora antimicrobica]SFO84546.1 Protein of unknown function [Saccharopolyspora antimicrobica]
MSSPVVWFVVAVGLLLLAALIVAGLAWRRLRELRVGGIDVALRASKDGGRGWHLGVAHYRGEEFTWYRVLSLRSGPNWVINRRDVEIARRREPTVSEAYAMPAGSTVLDLTGPDLELAMGRDALTGFLSWLESAPPGRSVPWAS